ncbi:MAG: C69 family dipeptidase [Candidatus Thorarchaeota archaeon]|nr:C69 family dipeptidase [Candidatus Thorarchaeota archaeon]
MVALGKATRDGHTIFGKNSDRPPNEAQIVEYHPSADHDEELVKCTHISIPQIKHTHAIFISRPYWMWGAEMGANEHDVVIGNEAVFSKEEVPAIGLLGMDLLRLGLERGRNAREALDIITELLEAHGQGGPCEFGGILTYHNSFIIADDSEAWVLETSQRRWIAEKVDDVRSISNGYTIGSEWNLASSDLVEYAIGQDWVSEKESFSFKEIYGNEMMDYITECTTRQANTSEYLEQKKGGIAFEDIARILRSHPVDWKPWKYENPPICQHTSHTRRDSSTGSQISEMSKQIHWFTGSSNPCFSLYMPFVFRDPYIYKGWDTASEKYTDESFWWRRERVNRRQSEKNPKVMSEVHKYIESLQKEIHKLASFMWKKEEFQKNVNEFEEFFKRTAPTTENAQDIDEEYLKHMANLNKEAGIDSY